MLRNLSKGMETSEAAYDACAPSRRQRPLCFRSHATLLRPCESLSLCTRWPSRLACAQRVCPLGAPLSAPRPGFPLPPMTAAVHSARRGRRRTSISLRFHVHFTCTSTALTPRDWTAAQVREGPEALPRLDDPTGGPAACPFACPLPERIGCVTDAPPAHGVTPSRSRAPPMPPGRW